MEGGVHERESEREIRLGDREECSREWIERARERMDRMREIACVCVSATENRSLSNALCYILGDLVYNINTSAVSETFSPNVT